MINQTLLKIIGSREDISDYLFHFTKGTSAIDSLDSIIQNRAIRDINGSGVICFTEVPILMVNKMFELFEFYSEPMYARNGIGIRKEYLYNLGARPVIYGTDEEKCLLHDDIKWRFEKYIPNIRDFSWLREWRIKACKVCLEDKLDFFIITNTSEELTAFTFDSENIGNIEFDGDVEDGGEFHGYAYTSIPRNNRGISFEGIRSLNLLSKHEVHKLLSEQSFEDTEKMSLGGF